MERDFMYNRVNPTNEIFRGKQEILDAFQDFLEKAGASVQVPPQRLIGRGADFVISFSIVTKEGSQETLSLPIRCVPDYKTLKNIGKFTHNQYPGYFCETGLAKLLQRGVAVLVKNFQTIIWLKDNGHENSEYAESVRGRLWVETQEELLKQQRYFGITKGELELTV